MTNEELILKMRELLGRGKASMTSRMHGRAPMPLTSEWVEVMGEALSRIENTVYNEEPQSKGLIMIKRSDFVNELGNEIEMSVDSNPRNTVVFAKGPNSQVEHTWTRLEAKTLRDLLTESLDHDSPYESML